MRELFAFELTRVAGGGDSPSGPTNPCHCECPDEDKGKGKNKNRRKGNNGFGNGGNDGVPGNSGFSDTDR